MRQLETDNLGGIFNTPFSLGMVLLMHFFPLPLAGQIGGVRVRQVSHFRSRFAMLFFRRLMLTILLHYVLSDSSIFDGFWVLN